MGVRGFRGPVPGRPEAGLGVPKWGIRVSEGVVERVTWHPCLHSMQPLLPGCVGRCPMLMRHARHTTLCVGRLADLWRHTVPVRKAWHFCLTSLTPPSTSCNLSQRLISAELLKVKAKLGWALMFKTQGTSKSREPGMRSSNRS